jgi:hypothetical protein
MLDNSRDQDKLQSRFEKAFRGRRIHAHPADGKSPRTWTAPQGKDYWTEARKWIARQKNCKLYFSPAVIKPGSARTTKDDMQESVWLWADLDPRDGEDLEAERVAMLSLLTTDPIVPPPTMIIDSGRGLWGFWKLKASHVFDGRSGDATRAFEAVLRGLGQSFAPYGDRSVKNINRIARLPNTLNSRTNARSSVLAFNDTTYTLADFPSVVIERKVRADADVDAVPLDIVKQALAVTTYTGGPKDLDDRHSEAGWFDFMVSVHEAARGDSGEYLDAFYEWCRNDPEFDPEWTYASVQTRWESLDCDAAGGITRASWIKLLVDLGEDELASQMMQLGEDAGPEFSRDPEPVTKKQAEINKKKTKTAATFGLNVTKGSDIVMRTIDWIWDGHLALGNHTAIAGVQGDGKSQLVYALVAAVTNGSTWPGTKEKAPQGHCIVLNAEDGAEDVLGPRLAAAGANMAFVHVVNSITDNTGKDRKFSLLTDLERLTKLANSIGGVKLITFDPVSSYLGGDLDSHSNTELRDALDPITTMAWNTGAAVISVTHFNKSGSGVSALNRVMGSAGFTAAPRSAFAVIRDADDPEIRMLLSLKSNLAAVGEAYGMCFTLASKKVGTDKRNDKTISAPFVVWGERTDMTADEALQASQAALVKKARTPALDEARDFLIAELDGRPEGRLVNEIQQDAKGMGIQLATLRRAREALGVISEKAPLPPGRGPWSWILPDDGFKATAEAEFGVYDEPAGSAADEANPWD